MCIRWRYYAVLLLVVLAFVAGTAFGVLGWPAAGGGPTFSTRSLDVDVETDPMAPDLAQLAPDSAPDEPAATPDSTAAEPTAAFHEPLSESTAASDSPAADSSAASDSLAAESTAAPDSTPAEPTAASDYTPAESTTDPDFSPGESFSIAQSSPRPVPLDSLSSDSMPAPLSDSAPSSVPVVWRSGSASDCDQRDLQAGSVTLSPLMGEIVTALDPVRHRCSPDPSAAIRLGDQLQLYTASRPPVTSLDPSVRVPDLDAFLDAVQHAYEVEVQRAADLLSTVTVDQERPLFPLNDHPLPVDEWRGLLARRPFHDALGDVIGATDRFRPLRRAITAAVGRRLRHSLEETVTVFTDPDDRMKALRIWSAEVRALFDGDQRGPPGHVLAMAQAERQLLHEWLYLDPDSPTPLRLVGVEYEPELARAIDGVYLLLPSRPGSLTRRHQRCLRCLNAVLARHAAHLTRCTQSRLRATRDLHAASVAAKSAMEALLARLNAWPKSEVGTAPPPAYVTWCQQPPPLTDAALAPMRREVRAMFLLLKQCGIVDVLRPSSRPVSVEDLGAVAAQLAALYGSCSEPVRTQLELLERTYNLRAGTLGQIKNAVDVGAILRGGTAADPVRALVRWQRALPQSWRPHIRAAAWRLFIDEDVDPIAYAGEDVTTDDLRLDTSMDVFEESCPPEAP